MMDELRKLWELIDTNNINIRARYYVRSAANVLADRLSREKDMDEWQLNPRIFTYVDSLWGPHSIDRFTTHGNSQLPRYNSRHTSEAVDCLHLPDNL
jgi:methionine aminopeptidase